MQSTKPKVGYVAAVLDEATRRYISAFAIHANVHCNHCTLAYNVPEDSLGELSELVGQEIEITSDEIRNNDDTQAINIKGIACSREHLHITISCRQGVKPGESIRLFSENAATHIEPVNFKLKATVQFIPFPKQPK